MNNGYSNIIYSLNKIVEEIKKGCLSVFAGAGVSCSSGYVDWKTLLSPIYKQLGISDKIDLTVGAQYFENKYNRQFLNTLIIDEFTKNASRNQTLEMLASLPIESFWTTNYDSLIEETLREHGKTVDVIVDQLQFKYHPLSREAVVYKMHGDKSCPDKVILTKRDYEKYDKDRMFFSHSLKYELITKTFLFIGFSFTDPNFDRIIAYVKNAFGEHAPKNHFCFMRKINQSDYYNNGVFDEEKYNEDKILQELRTTDMIKYGIQTIWIDNFEQIPLMLQYIKARLEMDNIFISGSIDSDSKDNNTNSGNNDDLGFMYELSRRLIEQGFNIYTGYGKEVGSNIVSGIFSEAIKSNISEIDRRIHIYPLVMVKREEEGKERDSESVNNRLNELREKLIEECGFFITMYGKNIVDEKVEPNDGAYKEYEIAKSKKKIIIPIGATGRTAKYIYDIEMKKVNKKYKSKMQLLKEYRALGQDSVNADMVSNVMSIIEEMKGQKEKELEMNLKNSMIQKDDTKKKIFISYHYNNECKIAREIIALLNKSNKYDIVNVEDKKIEGHEAVEKWIDRKILDAKLTMIIIGEETAERKFVKYELDKSISGKKAILGISLSDSVKNPLDELNVEGHKASEVFKTYQYNIDQKLDWWSKIIDEAFDIASSIYGNKS